MPIRDIVTDKKVLSMPCLPIAEFLAKDVIQDLMDTANSMKRQCAGLAANQIGYQKRVFVIKIKGKFKAFVNPLFTPAGVKFTSTESCLSFPGIERNVKRYNIIVASAPRGKIKVITLSGREAVAFQHELDHLDGKTIMGEG
jgi:peptide deformylase